MRSLEEDLAAARAYHGHLCHGMVMGVRMARYAGRELGIDDPRSYRDLIVYVFSLPVSTMQNVRHADLPGVTLAGETAIAGLRVKASFDWQDPQDRATGKRLTYRAATHGVLGVSRQTDSWEAGAELVASGPRYTDLANTRHVAGYARVDLYAAWRVARDWKLAARVNNALDADYNLNAGYNTPGVNAFVGIEYQTR